MEKGFSIHRRIRPAHRVLATSLEKIVGLVETVNFGCITCIQFNCNQHAMFETHTLINTIKFSLQNSTKLKLHPGPLFGNSWICHCNWRTCTTCKISCRFFNSSVRNYQYLLEVERHVLSHLFHFSIAGIILDYQNYTYIHRRGEEEWVDLLIFQNFLQGAPTKCGAPFQKLCCMSINM